MFTQDGEHPVRKERGEIRASAFPRIVSEPKAGQSESLPPPGCTSELIHFIDVSRDEQRVGILIMNVQDG
jgi:hypothetical protein